MSYEVRFPGTNIDVLVSSNIIEIRNDDYLRSIEYSGMKYEDVLDEIQRIIANRGWEITKRVIKYVLDRLGLPEAEYFPSVELSEDESTDLSKKIDSIKEPAGLRAEASEEIPKEAADNLSFKFHAENIPKEAPERNGKSKESDFDWEEAPPIGPS
ncbi:MAG: hypothetical protein ACFFER_13035 [Candidatus Thorarchaeota archaeon]